MTNLKEALTILKQNGVVAMPTETVYGLAGSIDSEEAIKKIFSVKERPFFDPLIVHVSSIEMAKPLTKSWNNLHQKLADIFWPGPLTMVIDKSEQVSDLITSGLQQVGIRYPAHQIAIELITQFGAPLAAPSANKFTKTSPTSASHVYNEFQDEVYILDGGECEVGIESTVIGIFENEIKIYRPGMITSEEIRMALSEDFSHIEINFAQSPVAPGQMKHHYMPKKPVTLTTMPVEGKSSWIVPSDPTLAARQLYSKLRELDEKEGSEIFIILKEDFKNDERYSGVLNRLNKAKTTDLYFNGKDIY